MGLPSFNTRSRFPVLSAVSPDQPFFRACFLSSSFSVSDIAWPSANRAIYQPVIVYEESVYDQMAVSLGTTTSGTPHVDLGIYDGLSLAKLGSTGSTVVAASSWQEINLSAAVTLVPGFYFLALACDVTTQNFSRATLAGAGVFYYEGAMGQRQEASAFTLPATATPVFPASLYVPVFGALRSDVAI